MFERGNRELHRPALTHRRGVVTPVVVVAAAAAIGVVMPGEIVHHTNDYPASLKPSDPEFSHVQREAMSAINDQDPSTEVKFTPAASKILTYTVTYRDTASRTDFEGNQADLTVALTGATFFNPNYTLPYDPGFLTATALRNASSASREIYF